MLEEDIVCVEPFGVNQALGLFQFQAAYGVNSI